MASFTAEISVSFVELRSEKARLCLNYSKSRANLSCGKNRIKIRKKSCNVNNNIGLGNIKISGFKENVTFHPDFRLVFGINHDFFFHQNMHSYGIYIIKLKFYTFWSM